MIVKLDNIYKWYDLNNIIALTYIETRGHVNLNILYMSCF
jgi:hypothetical protein